MTKTCATCKFPKSIHFFTPSQWNSNSPSCIGCVKKSNKRYRARGLDRGWRDRENGNSTVFVKGAV